METCSKHIISSLLHVYWRNQPILDDQSHQKILQKIFEKKTLASQPEREEEGFESQQKISKQKNKNTEKTG